MRLEFGWDTTWNCLRIFSMRCDWILAKPQFGINLGYFQSDAVGIGLWQNLELSWNIFNEKDRHLAKTQFGTVLECFRWDATGIWLRHNLELSWIILDEMRLEFGWDTNWNCLRRFSMRCDWNLAETQFGSVLEFFRWDAVGIWLRHNLE